MKLTGRDKSIAKFVALGGAVATIYNHLFPQHAMPQLVEVAGFIAGTWVATSSFDSWHKHNKTNDDLALQKESCVFLLLGCFSLNIIAPLAPFTPTLQYVANIGGITATLGLLDAYILGKKEDKPRDINKPSV